MLILIVKPDVKVNIMSHAEDKLRVDENICLVTRASLAAIKQWQPAAGRT